MSKIGLIKNFNSNKEFGFITNTEQKDIYFNYKNLKIDINILDFGVPISYKIFFDKKTKKTSAVNCKLLNSYEDFVEIMKMDSSLRTSIRFPSGHVKNKSSKSQILIFQTKNYCFRNLLSQLSDELFQDYALRYYQDNKTKISYIPYSLFLFNRIVAIRPQTDERRNLITQLFSQFRSIVNEEDRFDLWRNNNYRLLGYENYDELIIDEETIRTFKHKFNLDNLKLLSEKLNTENIRFEIFQDNLSVEIEKGSEYFHTLKKSLEFLATEHSTYLLPSVEDKLLRSVEAEMIKKIDNYGAISSEYQISWYDKLKEEIPDSLLDESKVTLINKIDNLLIQNMTSELKINLFIENKKSTLDNVSTEDIVRYMKKQYEYSKIKLLGKIPSVQKQAEILLEYAKDTKVIDAFSLIKNLFLSDNKLNDNKDFLFKKFQSEWINNYKHAELVNFLLSHIENEEDLELRKNYFFKGLIRKLSEDQIIEEILEFNIEKILFIFNNPYYGIEFKKKCALIRIEKKISSSYELEKFLKICKDFFDSNFYVELYKVLISSIDEYQDYNLWRTNLSIKFPSDYLKSKLDDNETFYRITLNTINENEYNKEDFTNILIEYLTINEPIINRRIFIKKFLHIKYLLLCLPNSEKTNLFENNKTYKNIAWFFNKVDDLDFETLKNDFIYFEPENQRILLRKIFYYIKVGKLNISIEDINDIKRVDADIYKLNEEFNPDVSLDFTIDLVISSLYNFKNKGRFLVQNELLELVLKTIYNHDKKITVSDFFEECKGIQNAEYKFNFSTDRKINIVKVDDCEYFYSISFDYNKTLVEDVKNIPGRRWDSNTLKWSIPSTSKDSLISFATRWSFIINGPSGDMYLDNKHLVKFFRGEKPTGVTYCEGRKSKTLDRRFDKTFWWCRSQICFQNCESSNGDDWMNYNFLDFCLILGYDLTEINKMNDVIPNGYYYHFTSLLNRFKILLEKLNCKSCNHILQPFSTGDFGAYTITKFNCKNNTCSNGHEIIYLNHCLNGQCNNIIDSRISKKCNHGLFICDVCGSCCSHAMFSRRVTNLQTNNGFIHQELIVNVNNKLGHLERAEYFCYKCGEEMNEISLDVFKCSHCNVSYDTKKYRFKRENRGLKHQ